jgi:hypothetical protein
MKSSTQQAEPIEISVVVPVYFIHRLKKTSSLVG